MANEDMNQLRSWSSLSSTPKADPHIMTREIQVRDYDPELLDTMRDVVDDTLRECGAYTLTITTGSTHVELIDGDINTANLSEEIVKKMNELGWQFVKTLPWVIVTEEEP